MSVLDELLDLHRSMLLFIRNESKTIEREAIIEQINDFHQKRKPLLDQLTPPQTEEELTKANELDQFNNMITRFIEQNFNEVKKDIQVGKQKKKHNHHYSDPYGKQRGTDGAFYDKRK